MYVSSERERSCEASQNTCPGMTERMQFTFRVGVASLAPVALSEFGTGLRIGFGRSGSGGDLHQRR
ncbi:hypothetical protein M405DRAFT_885528, partial [Rhizopogon salebrosus TDB-379]